jgi:catechol-2,3-dioxygenase
MRLLELILPGIDLDELRQFYCAILGLREIEPASTGRLGVQCSATQLFFRPAGADWHGRYHFAFDVPSKSNPKHNPPSFREVQLA